MSWKKLTVAMAAMMALFIIGREFNLTQLANHRMQQQIMQMQQQITKLQQKSVTIKAKDNGLTLDDLMILQEVKDAKAKNNNAMRQEISKLKSQLKEAQATTHTTVAQLARLTMQEQQSQE